MTDNTTLWEDDDRVTKQFVAASQKLRSGTAQGTISAREQIALAEEMEECFKQFIRQQAVHWATAIAIDQAEKK